MTAELSSQCYPYLSGLPLCYCCSPYDFNSASKENFKDKSPGYINKLLYNHNKTQQNTTMCIYCGIYCANRHSTTQCYKFNCLHPVKYVCVCVFYAVSLMWRQDIVSPSFGPTPLSGSTLVIMAGLVIGHPSSWPLRTPETWWQDQWPSLSIVNTPGVQYMWDVQRKETLPPRVTSTTNLNEVGQSEETVTTTN